MKKLIAILILFVACKQSETTNSTTMTESSATTATVATMAPTDTTPTMATQTTATVAIQTVGTNPAASTAPMTTTTAAAPRIPAPVPVPTTTTAPPPPPPPVSQTTATHAIETVGTNPAAATSAPPASDATYRAKGCNVCHGASGAGDTPMGKAKNIPDFRSATVQNKSDADLVKIIRDAPQHKAKALTEEQAKSVVAWIRTLK